MTKSIYLDNSTIAKPSDLAISAMMPFFTDMWGSTSAPHHQGQELLSAAEEGFRSLYSLLGAEENDDIIFTSSGAEAINQVYFSAYYDHARHTGKNQIITTNCEEAPALMSLGRLEQLGCIGKMVEVSKGGYVTAKAIADAMSPRTGMVSLSWANGLTGVVNPVAEIAEVCHERGVPLHIDATHVLGKLYFDLEDIGASFITFNGDQLHAPKGTGALYIKSGARCSPFIVGGAEQSGHRAGALNVPLLVSLGCAARELSDSRDLVCSEAARLRDKLELGIVKGFPQAMPFFKDQERLPTITTIAFPGIANEAMLYSLNRKGVYASIGGGGFQQIGLILIAAGVEEILSHSAVGFSLSRETTEDEVDQAIAIIVDTANRLSKMSKKLMEKK